MQNVLQQSASFSLVPILPATSDHANNPEMKDGFLIHPFGSTDNSYFMDPEQQRLQWYEVVWFISAEGMITVDSQRQALRNQAIYYFVPGQMRQFQFAGNMLGYRIAFSQDFLNSGRHSRSIDAWMEATNINSLPVVIDAGDDFRQDLEEIIRKMQREFTNYYLLRSEILCGLLNILIIHFSRKLNASAKDFTFSKDTDLVMKFKSLLKRDFLTRKQVGDYAGELCVTANYLNRTVKKITGFTASHHIQQQIILEAKRKAMQSNVSMKEIAYFLGFDNLAHFSKFFKNNSGMNFSTFKKGLMS